MSKKSDQELRETLTEEQYWVTQKAGTERPFTGCFHDHKAKGMYQCICCHTPLFRSSEKFDSGSGWPSYWQPISQTAVKEYKDQSHGMTRVEVRCGECDAHLGHVFPDGPPPSGLRYCINSASLEFIPTDTD